jgi:hypothetical protein
LSKYNERRAALVQRNARGDMIFTADWATGG